MPRLGAAQAADIVVETLLNGSDRADDLDGTCPGRRRAR
jgi:hypothetical protein